MIHSRLLLISGAFALASIVAAQTQPQLPNLVPVPATPDITLPPQPKVDPALTKPLTAAEAAMIGLKLQPNVTVALAQARLAAALVVQSRAALLPSIDLNTGTTYATSISGLGVSTNSGGTPVLEVEQVELAELAELAELEEAPEAQRPLLVLRTPLME